MNKRPFFVLAVLTVALCTACSGANKSAGSDAGSSQASAASPGVQAPAWSDPLSSGGVLASASLSGKPVYLNFFASWCPPCNAEAPSINVLYERYKARGLKVVGVDVLENAGKARGFIEKYHLAYPVVIDSGLLRDAYNVNGLPVHVFIARDGTIRNIVIGEMEPAEINAAIKSIL
ncbi:MAG: TlpA family protein disulfide reductase [Vulcanimicrobiaceae bacterium]